MYKPGDSYVGMFITAIADGTATDADALPVAKMNHNGTDDGAVTLTVAKIDTGRYKVTGTIPGGYAAGDVVIVSVSATIATVATKQIVDKFVLDRRVNDLHDLATTDVENSVLDAVSAAHVTPGSIGEQIASNYPMGVTAPALATIVTTAE